LTPSERLAARGNALSDIQERKVGALIGLAYGDALGGAMVGWSEDKARSVLGDLVGGAPTTWPPAARGLPLPERKNLRKLGLHGIETQLVLAVANELPVSDGDVERLQYCLVRGFELQAWRTTDRRMLKIAHLHRSQSEVNAASLPDSGLGPICLGIPAALYGRGNTEGVISRALDTARVVYRDELTSILAAYVAGALDLTIRLGGEFDVPGELSRVCEVIGDRLSDGHGNGAMLRQVSVWSDQICAARPHERDSSPDARTKTSIETEAKAVITAVQLGCSTTGDVEQTMGRLFVQGGSTSAAYAVAASMLGARLRCPNTPQDHLTDIERIRGYAHAIAEGDLPFEGTEDFFRIEADLTRSEQAFRDEMAAERRTT